jgi:hypothetical protein
MRQNDTALTIAAIMAAGMSSTISDLARIQTFATRGHTNHNKHAGDKAAQSTKQRRESDQLGMRDWKPRYANGQ